MIRLGFAVLCVAAILTLGYLYQDFQKFRIQPSTSVVDHVFEVKPGDSLGQVGKRLHNEGLISQLYWFKVLAYLNQADTKIKAGEFTIKAGASPESILETLVAGEVNQYSITLIEGWTLKQVLVALKKNQFLKQTLSQASEQGIVDKIGISYKHPEGLFLPETYFFTNNTTDLDILRRAYRNMLEVLDQEWQNKSADLPLKSAYEALILASIVEKETALDEERATIAGVFIRRLKKGMRLQTDPTVIYGMGDRFKGNIRRKDLRTDTPYNTYTRDGLPPTPIALPGQAAINAVLHPAEGDALFFVANGKGSHVFSATLKQHNQAVNKYQKKIRVKR
ncbi:MAG: endolytic transglycosylase MltG [Gammaproteobacteria bacterium]|nr:endolytic transglycosylase MltG [Gammaproteobacteria bacterium]